MSRPTTYFYMTASTTDGKSHTVMMYSDVSSREWFQRIATNTIFDMCLIEWGATANLSDSTVGFANDSDLVHLFTAVAEPARYSEVDQQSPAVTVFYSMQQVCREFCTFRHLLFIHT